jgi:hypothetical protein
MNNQNLTSENNAYEGQYVAVPEGTHDVHFSHEILLCLAACRLLQHFDSHDFRLLTIFSPQFA